MTKNFVSISDKLSSLVRLSFERDVSSRVLFDHASFWSFILTLPAVDRTYTSDQVSLVFDFSEIAEAFPEISLSEDGFAWIVSFNFDFPVGGLSE